MLSMPLTHHHLYATLIKKASRQSVGILEPGNTVLDIAKFREKSAFASSPKVANCHDQ